MRQSWSKVMAGGGEDEEDDRFFSMEAPEDLYLPKTKPLTIRISGDNYIPISPAIPVSPSALSPPSSAFVSALQSPYISPRAFLPPPPATGGAANNHGSTTTTTTTTNSCSDDHPSTSYTPPSESCDDPRPEPAAPPRISFSFPVPRVSFTKASISPSCNAKLRSCDVFIGYHPQTPNPNLSRFCKWLRSELEFHGIAAFAADRGKYSDAQSHEIADRIICSAAFGVVIITSSSFLNPFTIEEIRFFAQKKNLIPLWFDAELEEISRQTQNKPDDKERREALDGLTKFSELKFEADENSWRSCISRVVAVLSLKLGRKISPVSSELSPELPFLRNRSFVGREKELGEMESAFFGCGLTHDTDTHGGAAGSKEPAPEAWIEGRSTQKQRSKHRRSKFAGGKVLCIGGGAGMGKTELALEFAHRFSQRYKMVLWVGGEAKFLRQNLLNAAKKLKVDVGVEDERERGRIRSFEEQEVEAFQRLKKEIFRDVPYLLVIDNLETEKEWWEGKDLHDLIPRNTGATHVIMTTRLQKVMSFEQVHLQPLQLAEALTLIGGGMNETEALKKFVERLEGLTFGLVAAGSLLTQMRMSPAELFEAVDGISLCGELFSLVGARGEEENSFLTKLLIFCMAALDRAAGKGSLGSRMILAGAWFAPAPVNAALLAAATADRDDPAMGLRRPLSSFCCYSPCVPETLARSSEVEAARMAVKLGLARRAVIQPGCWIHLHPITRSFARRRSLETPPLVRVMKKIGDIAMNWDHLWAIIFLVFGYKAEPPLVHLPAEEMAAFIKRIAVPVALKAFVVFSRCSSALELLKVCTGVLEEAEKKFVTHAQAASSSGWWKGKLQGGEEMVWKEVTLLKASVMETRAKLLLRGGYFDSGEELCRSCISIRTVMLGHAHVQTLAAQETLAKLVRLRSKV